MLLVEHFPLYELVPFGILKRFLGIVNLYRVLLSKTNKQLSRHQKNCAREEEKVEWADLHLHFFQSLVLAHYRQNVAQKMECKWTPLICKLTLVQKTKNPRWIPQVTVPSCFQTENLVIKCAVSGACLKLLLIWNPGEMWKHGKISLQLWINISEISPERTPLKISRQLNLLLLLFSLACLVWDWERRWQFSEINPDLRLPIHSAVLGSHLLQTYVLYTWSLPFIFFFLQRSFSKFPLNIIRLLGELRQMNTTEERGHYPVFLNSAMTPLCLITVSEYLINARQRGMQSRLVPNQELKPHQHHAQSCDLKPHNFK